MPNSATTWTAACQASLSFPRSQSLLELMCFQSRCWVTCLKLDLSSEGMRSWKKESKKSTSGEKRVHFPCWVRGIGNHEFWNHTLLSPGQAEGQSLGLCGHGRDMSVLKLKSLQRPPKGKPRDILGGPMVKTPCWPCRGTSSMIPCWGTKILRGKKKERWEARSEQRMKRMKKSINSESFSKRTASPSPSRKIPWTGAQHCSPWGHKELDTTERLHFTSLIMRLGQEVTVMDIQRVFLSVCSEQRHCLYHLIC